MKAVAVIPARGGSKRIPLKNIKDFGGKPMLAWSVEAALESGCFERVIVSTDDENTATIARQYGAEVPFMRPAHLAGDHAATTPVVRHAIEWCGENAELPELVCCIYATAPFVRAEDIRLARDLLSQEQCDYVFSVSGYEFPIQRAVRINSGGRVEMFDPQSFSRRSQDLEPAYHDAGQFYWGTANAWLGEKKVFDTGSCPYVLPRHLVQDIDTPEDWVRAEWLFKAMQLEHGKGA